MSAADLELMRRLDEQYTRTPFYGSRRMTAWLRTQGYVVNRKRVARLLAVLGLEAMVPRRRLSAPAPGHRIYPYLLRGVSIDRVDQVWSTDITYIRLAAGVCVPGGDARLVQPLRAGLGARVDAGHGVLPGVRWRRRCARGSRRSSTPTRARSSPAPPSRGGLEAAGVQISMDGRGRALDNVFVERLWRSVKYEEVYLKDYTGFTDAARNLAVYFRFYNRERLHQALGYRTPAAVYRAAA